MKRCFKCLRDLPVEQFYRHRMMADGRLSKCVDCTRNDARDNRDKNVEKVRAYDRARAALPHRLENNRRVSEAWRLVYPDRKNAAGQAARAVKAGKLTKPDECESCGRAVRLEKHHPDYSKPLLVLWLCKPCHAVADKIRRRLETA